VQHGKHTHDQPDAGNTEHDMLQPLLPGEERNGRHGNSYLQYRGGLRPTMMLMHLLIAALVPLQRLRLQSVGNGLDLRFFLFVTGDFGLIVLLPAPRGEIAGQFGLRLLGALGLEIVPLVRCLGLLDGGIVLEQAGIGLGSAAHVGKDRPDGGDDRREHGDLVDHSRADMIPVAVMTAAARCMLQFVIMRAMHVKSA